MVVVAIGEVDVFTAPQLDAELTRLTHEGRTSIVVDLSRVDFLDSTGLSVLVKALKRVRESEGALYGVVTVAPKSGGKPGEAAALVADAIRDRYYYDESAGIPICLEKSIRTANQTLRQARESHGLAPGAIGACAARRTCFAWSRQPVACQLPSTFSK